MFTNFCIKNFLKILIFGTCKTELLNQNLSTVVIYQYLRHLKMQTKKYSVRAGWTDGSGPDDWFKNHLSEKVPDAGLFYA